MRSNLLKVFCCSEGRSMERVGIFIRLTGPGPQPTLWGLQKSVVLWISAVVIFVFSFIQSMYLKYFWVSCFYSFEILGHNVALKEIWIQVPLFFSAFFFFLSNGTLKSVRKIALDSFNCTVPYLTVKTLTQGISEVGKIRFLSYRAQNQVNGFFS